MGLTQKGERKQGEDRNMWYDKNKAGFCVRSDGDWRLNSCSILLRTEGGSQYSGFSVLKLGQPWASWGELVTLRRAAFWWGCPVGEVVRASLRRQLLSKGRMKQGCVLWTWRQSSFPGREQNVQRPWGRSVPGHLWGLSKGQAVRSIVFRGGGRGWLLTPARKGKWVLF